MVPILLFLSTFEEYIIGITIFTEHCDNNKETTIDHIQNIKIKSHYVYFMGGKDALHIPINGTIIDLDYENGETNVITVFNKKIGYIKTKKLPIFD